MREHADLALDLALLTEALTDHEVDLAVEVDLLAAHAAQAVESYLGLSVTVDVPPVPFTLTVMRSASSPAPAGASLRFPAPGPHGEPTAVAVTLFAAVPGAFVDLAADLAFMFGLDLDDVVLDGHLDGAAVAGGTGLADLSVINQAIGVLIEQGHDPDTAHVTLITAAATTGRTVATAAAAVLDDLSARVAASRAGGRPPRSDGVA